MRHLELFAGIGGFRRALDLIGHDFNVSIDCIGFSEIDSNAMKTYYANFHPTDNEINIGDIVPFTSNKANIKALPDFDLLTGGFPCQTFSMMGNKLGFKDEDRGQMFFRILDILSLKKPKYILLENVKNLYTHDKGNTFKVVKSSLEKLGYTIYYDIFNSSDFHLAQNRNRVYILGIRGKQKNNIDFSAKTIKVYFDEIYQQTSVEKQNSVLDILEQNVSSTYTLSERIKPTILSDGSASFKSNSEINQDPARPLTATMHKMHRACQDNYYSIGYIHSRGKENPATILSKEELCRLEIRKLTPREAMMLQGFPETWSLNARNSQVSNGALYKQAGNAVSVNVVYAIMHYCIVKKIIKL